MALWSGIVRTIDRLFPERQLFLRSDGEVRFLVIGQRMQVALAVLSCALAVWFAVASYTLIVTEHLLARRDARIASLSEANDQLSSDLQAVHSRYEAITRTLETKHRFLRDVMRQRAGLERQLELLSGGLGSGDDALADGAAQGEVVGALSTAQRLEQSLHAMGDRLSQALNERDAAQARNERLEASVDALQARLASTESDRARLSSDLVESRQKMNLLADERSRITSQNSALTGKVSTLEQRLALLEQSQRTLVSRIHQRTDANIKALEAAVNLTGIDLEQLLKRVRKDDGMGGPLIELGPDKLAALTADPKTASAFGNSLETLEQRLRRWAALNTVLEILPLSAPLDQYRITSGFGAREDPFTHHKAFHSGLDMAGPYHAIVYNTAPGVVTRVGWEGAYGKVVEIDHGHGLRTRYGHLSKVLVKKGQKVGHHHKIGVMGNTGRSTGQHVHYEVLFDGQAVDPARFLKAGNHVFKG
ncbi:MAG TPA: peptidoglycan DD-metalloendopeptidase family protein [Alphaproteobacteria bacterium]|nr:peptidoglycan DD-metalloendopeptidase family protein [Alphaproteobacteria bacterium]